MWEEMAAYFKLLFQHYVEELRQTMKPSVRISGILCFVGYLFILYRYIYRQV